MKKLLHIGLVFGWICNSTLGAEVVPASQQFRQEIARHYGAQDGLPAQPIQLLDSAASGAVRGFAAGTWYELRQDRWEPKPSLASPGNGQLALEDANGRKVLLPVPGLEVRQVLRDGKEVYVATSREIFVISVSGHRKLDWTQGPQIYQLAFAAGDGLYVAASAGLFRQSEQGWSRVEVPDGLGRNWATREVLGTAFDTAGQLWFATKAGVGCRSSAGWRFYEGKDGLPWNDFTGIASGVNGELWFATRLGAIRFDGKEWHYRQGPRWLPDDAVSQILTDGQGRTWFATGKGIGCIERKAMTLAEKAEWYEQEIERYIKRTPYGYVAEAALRQRADKSSANPHDNDNDGLWTAMYGAGEAFGFAATAQVSAKERARKAFEALRFLQKVTQGCAHSPPKGYVARTIRPVDLPDPNIGRIEGDREAQKSDKLWKVYEPRWPKSADGKWFWKSDTSSDELDGHYFFYPLYYDFCADTNAERERVREVVRDLTDHLLEHHFALIDHDGKPTRWAVYGPQALNHDPHWIAERGLKSLSILSYLAVAAHVTGDAKYSRAAKDLIDQHAYAHNTLHPKIQHGPGSGNQSDDEMAFMCYYNLLRYSQDTALKNIVHYSFFRSWVNEAPEMNPFFAFAYAAHSLEKNVPNVWGTASVHPWGAWQQDAMATLYGFPLDRLDWPHRNSHRLDIIELDRVFAVDLDSPERPRSRGYRVNGKVLPVENRHFSHWNTDPWRLDYGGNGGELSAGTVFLLPYYMGLYHGFIEKPQR
jgi:hypothetical protein